MGTDYGAVDYPVFQVWIVRKMYQHPLPNTLLAPPRKPFVDSVPMAVLDRQQAPLGTTAAYPDHALDKTATVVFVFSNISMWVASQEVPNLHPLIVLQSHVCHETIILIHLKCQQSLIQF